MKRILAVATTFAALLAKGTAAEPAGVLERIDNSQPSFFVRAQVDRESREYHGGDVISVKAICGEEAYLYVLYKQADGKIYQIFPNQAATKNLAPAKTVVQIPHADDRFRWRVAEPYGKETIKVLASKKPIDPLSTPDLLKGRFNPVDEAQLQEVEARLAKGPSREWAVFDLPIETLPPAPPKPPEAPKRIGVFFGVGEYTYNADHEQAQRRNGEQKPRPLNLPGANHDALNFADAMKRLGQLDDLRVYTNRLATRAQIKESITEWLPAATRPGDVVFVYFSGHGSKAPDDNGDEKDGVDEFILPSDVISAGVFQEMQRRRGVGGTVDPRLPMLESQLAAAKDKSQVLLRQTAVSDDEFGHWLQRLDGRQIVVISDSCFSGGLSSQEKGISNGDDEQLGFDFLDQEISSLKDIGQRECAMLAASTKDQTASLRATGDMSVMTYELVQLLQSSKAPVELSGCMPSLEKLMQEYFTKMNALARQAGRKELTPHQPILVNYCSRPAWLKP